MAEMTNTEALSYYRQITEQTELVDTNEFEQALEDADRHSDARKVHEITGIESDALATWAGYWARAFNEDTAQAEHDAFVEQWGE